MQEEYITVASFDVGLKNLAFYTEDVFMSDVEQLADNATKMKKTDLTQKRIGPMELKPSYAKLVDDVYKCGERVEEGCKVIDLSTEKNATYNSYYRRKLHLTLTEYLNVWKEVNILLIERQYVNTRKKSTEDGTVNMNALLIAESIYTWFIIHHPHIQVSYFPSRHKTFTLGAPLLVEKKNRKTGKMEFKKMTKADRKKWSIQETKRLCKVRNDDDFIKHLQELTLRKQKLDDISDATLQLQAWKLIELVLKQN